MVKFAGSEPAVPAGLSGLDGYPHVWAGAFPITSIEIDQEAVPGVGAYAAALAELALTVRREGIQDEHRGWTVITQAAAAIIPRVAQSAVVMSAASGLQVGAAHGELPAVMLTLERQTGQGPLTAVLTGAVPVRSVDVKADQRWPLFAQRVADLDVGGVLCTPLMVAGQVLGSLSLTCAAGETFDEQAEMLAAVFAAHAALAMLGVRDLKNSDAMAQSRDIIGQAKGMLMERHNLTAQQAFDQLVHFSQHSNRKLRDLCQDLTSTGHPEHGTARSQK